MAERSGRPGHLAAYLDDPVLLFVPVRLLLGLVTAAATALLAHGDRRVELPRGGAGLSSASPPSSSSFELLLPLLIVARDPERVLEVLLPTFSPVARALGPLSAGLRRSMSARRRQHRGHADEAAEEAERGDEGVSRRPPSRKA